MDIDFTVLIPIFDWVDGMIVSSVLLEASMLLLRAELINLVYHLSSLSLFWGSDF